MRCANENIRYINIKDKINILRNLKLSTKDIKEINSLIDDIYDLKNDEIHLVTKKELNKSFSENLKNKLIRPICYSPHKSSYIYTILILANYADRLINNGLSKESAILKALYCGSKLLRYHIFTLDKKLAMDGFVQKLSNDNFMFCDYLLISKLLDKDFGKKKNFYIERLRNDFKRYYRK